MKPRFFRRGKQIVIQADHEYVFDWRDADFASALYRSLLADWELR